MTFELKSLKIHDKMSEETVCFEASMCWNGKRVGFARNSGQGAPTEWHFDRREVEAEVMALAATQPVEFESEFQSRFETILDEIVYREDNIKQLSKMCRKGLAYRLKTDPQGQWTIMNRPYSAELARELKDQHGDALDKIAQEYIAELRLPRQPAVLGSTT